MHLDITSSPARGRGTQTCQPELWLCFFLFSFLTETLLIGPWLEILNNRAPTLSLNKEINKVLLISQVITEQSKCYTPFSSKMKCGIKRLVLCRLIWKRLVAFSSV